MGGPGVSSEAALEALRQAIDEGDRSGPAQPFDFEEFIALKVEEVASLAESLAQADRGEFASDEEIAAIWKKHGL